MKSVMLLAIAAGCGLVAMFLFQQVNARQANAEVEERVAILVAKVEISPGTKLDESNTEFKEFPITVVPMNPILKKEDFADRALQSRAFAGDIITLNKLSKKGQHAATNDIPSGMTLITIPADPSMIGNGLLQPGDRVDVMVSYRSVAQNTLGKDIKTVLEYIEVYATDDRREANVLAGASEKAKTVTLLATPEQSKLVLLAGEVGKLHLAMRSKEDKKSRVTDKDRFMPEEAEAQKILAEMQKGESGSMTPDQQAMQQDALKLLLEAQMKNAQQAAKQEEKKEPEDVEPEAPQWSVEIFAGNDKRVEHVEMSEGDLPESYLKERNAWRSRQKAKQQQLQKSKNPLVNGLKSFFGNEPKEDKS